MNHEAVTLLRSLEPHMLLSPLAQGLCELRGALEDRAQVVRWGAAPLSERSLGPVLPSPFRPVGHSLLCIVREWNTHLLAAAEDSAVIGSSSGRSGSDLSAKTVFRFSS
jgi:hypothetical protein